MDIFKLYESTIANIQPSHVDTKDLRRDQLLNNYDEATKTLEALIRAKENEISYRRYLIDMLEKSKDIYDKKLESAKQSYQETKKHGTESSDSKGSGDKHQLSTTSSSSNNTITSNSASVVGTTSISTNSQSSQKSSDLDLPISQENHESRSSLDRRLSEFLRTFPNLTQAGLAQPSNNNDIKPSPGYYTQQPMLQPPPQPMPNAPPVMAMMRFPPPPMIQQPPLINAANQENYETADMELSDHDEPNNQIAQTIGNLPPMIASAMQQGAGGKQGLRLDQPPPYIAGQQFHNPIQYTSRVNSLPFDPSIMDSRLVDSPSSSGSRDKHGDRSHRHSSSSGSSSAGGKHGSDKNKYSSSSTTGRSKRR